MSSGQSCLKKRELLHNPNIGTDELIRYGQDYLKQERPVDALDFFEKAGDLDGIRSIKELGLELGDPFLLQQASKMLKEPISELIWKQVGEKAMAEGRYQEALTAFRSAKEEEKVQEIQNLITPKPVKLDTPPTEEKG